LENSTSISGPKVKNTLNVDDFRPITILPTLSNALEYIVSDEIRTHVTEQ